MDAPTNSRERESADTPRPVRVATSPTGRTYSISVDGHSDTAVLETSRVNDTLVIAAHTGVPASMSGLGIGLVLVERLISDARSEGFAIIPLCPFVKAMARRHPDWDDVVR